MHDNQIHFWAHMLDECFDKDCILNEGKHWPEDYIKTAYNLIKQSKLGKASWYKDEYLKTDLNSIVQDFAPLSHKSSNLGFFMAIVRWFIEYSGDSLQKYQEFLERKLDNVIKTLLKTCNDKSYNSQIDTIKKMSFEQFEKLAEQVNAKSSSEDIQTAKSTKSYKVIPIYSYEELHKKYGGNKTGYKGDSEWCHTNGKSTYESWTKNGTQMFFVLEQDGWKDIQPPDPKKLEDCYDAYGMSLIAILVDVASGELLNSTSRWNHVVLPKSGAADTMFETWAQLNKATGMDVEHVCKTETAEMTKKLQQDIANANINVQQLLKKVDTIDDSTIPMKLKSVITQVDIPSNVMYIMNYAFYSCRGLMNVTISDSVTYIGSHAFDSCSGLTSITIPDSVTKIGNEAFYGCSGLTSVTIGNSVASIVEGVFYGCSGLTSVTIPDNVTSIGNYAFRYCSSLISVTIPNSVTSIGDDAFSYCSNLMSLVFNGKTLEQVKAMKNYPWGIKDISIIYAKR